MNLSRFISSVTLLLCAVSLFACGPFESMTFNPFVFHFYQEEETPVIDEKQRDENIALWQDLTSYNIQASEIETAVYEMTLSELHEAFESGSTNNAFLTWIINNKATEIKEFLLLAKELEELRFNRISPWYYPADKNERFDSRAEADKFASRIDRAKKHTTCFQSGRLYRTPSPRD